MPDLLPARLWYQVSQETGLAWPTRASEPRRETGGEEVPLRGLVVANLFLGTTNPISHCGRTHPITLWDL